eukprot:TRINITY_DN27206_c0_g1_i1.p1 TRINITY_DN27206_c0_g1~~TRINITY_DN27206_c0_g1_i1.p1  ORF type:complete len:129 (+),score=29.81 TRINITY_DN27206_c0_g1_i1:242-628(+)
MESKGKVYLFEEVSKHNNVKDCWLIIDGKVYDVTQFLEEHPGGDEVLLAATAKDATEDFEDVGHSDDARGMMEKYYIGRVDPSTVPSRPKYTVPKDERPKSEILLKVLQYVVPLGILGSAVAVHYLTK